MDGCLFVLVIIQINLGEEAAMPNEMKIVIDGYDDVVKDIKSMQEKSKCVVNRTVGDFKSRGPGWVAQEIIKVYNIKKKDINETDRKVIKGKSGIKISGAKLDDISIVYRGRLLTPTHFAMRPVLRPGRGSRYVVSAKIKKIQGRVNLGNKVFLAGAGQKSQIQIPWQRRSKERYPVDVVKTVSVPQMITNEQVSMSIHEQINMKLEKRLEHHLEQALK